MKKAIAILAIVGLAGILPACSGCGCEPDPCCEPVYQSPCCPAPSGTIHTNMKDPTGISYDHGSAAAGGGAGGSCGGGGSCG
jgi:hypothetical protein